MPTKSKPYKENSKQKPTRGWPPERRRAQAARIRQQKPWLKATGPRTEKGKARVSQNAYKHGRRSAPYTNGIRAISSLLRQQAKRIPRPPMSMKKLHRIHHQHMLEWQTLAIHANLRLERPFKE